MPKPPPSVPGIGQASYMVGLDGWLRAHAWRLVRLLLLLQLSAFAFLVAGTHGAFGPQKPGTTDFASFYAAGALADQGRAPAAYESAAHLAMERAVVGPGVIEQRFLNPPVFLLVCAPLARLPYLVAFVVFEAVTGLVWLVLATRVAGGGALAAACLTSVPAVWWAAGWGQNSFLSAGLMAAGTLLLARRPMLAGAALGALCFKPHFGVLIPVALLAGRHWRAVLGAALSVVGLGAVSVACFGVAAWAAFFDMARHAREAIETGIQLSGHVDLGGAARLAGLGTSGSWALQGAASLVAAGCVAWSWSRARTDPAAANAALVAGTLVAMPFVLFYDLVMAAAAAAWLARAARLGGWRAGEPTLLAVAWVLSLVAFGAAALGHLAVGVLVGPMLLWAALRRQGKEGLLF